MTDVKKITKKQFDVAYNQCLPNGWIRFAYKHFSNKAENKNMSMKNDIIYFLLGLFILGFVGTAIKVDKALIGVITITYTIVLAILVLFLFSAVMLNNRRLKKVMKILGVNKSEYNLLVDKYYK